MAIVHREDEEKVNLADQVSTPPPGILVFRCHADFRCAGIHQEPFATTKIPLIKMQVDHSEREIYFSKESQGTPSRMSQEMVYSHVKPNSNILHDTNTHFSTSYNASDHHHLFLTSMPMTCHHKHKCRRYNHSSTMQICIHSHKTQVCNIHIDKKEEI